MSETQRNTLNKEENPRGFLRDPTLSSHNLTVLVAEYSVPHYLVFHGNSKFIVMIIEIPHCLCVDVRDIVSLLIPAVNARIFRA